jgi:hypothetical protein
MKQAITTQEAYEMFDEMLDDCNSEVDVCGYTYAPHYALKTLDPIAYQCAFNDWTSSMEEEFEIKD